MYSSTSSSFRRRTLIYWPFSRDKPRRFQKRWIGSCQRTITFSIREEGGLAVDTTVGTRGVWHVDVSRMYVRSHDVKQRASDKVRNHGRTSGLLIVYSSSVLFPVGRGGDFVRAAKKKGGYQNTRMYLEFVSLLPARARGCRRLRVVRGLSMTGESIRMAAGTWCSAHTKGRPMHA